MWEVCMCGWETGVRRQSLRNSILRTFLAMSYPTPTFWQHLSLVWSSLINLDCQASEPQGSPCLCLPETGITSMSHHSQPFYVGSEYQIHFTWLVWQAFLPTEPSLQTYGCVGGGGRWAVRACTSTVLFNKVCQSRPERIVHHSFPLVMDSSNVLERTMPMPCWEGCIYNYKQLSTFLILIPGPCNEQGRRKCEANWWAFWVFWRT